MHLLRVNFINNLLAGDRPTTEFLTNTPLEDVLEDYAATCQAKFHAASSVWQQYMEAAARCYNSNTKTSLSCWREDWEISNIEGIKFTAPVVQLAFPHHTAATHGGGIRKHFNCIQQRSAE